MSAPESLGQRLARLKREAPAPSTSRANSDPGAERALPVWMQARMQSRAKRRHAGGPAPQEPSSPKSEAKLLAMQRASNEHGAYSVRERIHPEHSLHGEWKLSAVDEARSGDIALLAGDPALEGLDLRRAIYLDVETTGLSGGAGTTSFLVALGRFEGSHFHLWQGFLEGPEEERAMLFEVAQRVRASEAVVSFFGKSFDRHRLEDKMRLHHIDPPFADRPHLDLYHPLNRLYKRSLPNGRLCTMEQSLCALRRLDDLPGSFAPEAWFDYLGKRAHRLEAVFQHNADDVLSLVTLAAHLGRAGMETCGDGSPLSGSAAARALAWALLHGKRAQPALALEWLRRALQRAPEWTGDRQVLFEAGIWCRQLGRREEALQRFQALAREHSDHLACQALVEAAKLWEHGEATALGWAQALQACARAEGFVGQLPGHKALRLGQALARRRARLERKLNSVEV